MRKDGPLPDPDRLHMAGTAAHAYAGGLRDAAAMLQVDRQTIRLHAGELSPQEMRAVLAVLSWKRREMLERADRA